MAFATLFVHTRRPMPHPSSCTLHKHRRRSHSQFSQRVQVRASAEASESTPLSPELVARVQTYLRDHPDGANAPSPLSYVTLREMGRTDLVEEIMDAGGYISVSEKLGIRVDTSYASYKPPPLPSDLPSLFSPEEDAGSLALGAGLSARLDVDVNSLPPAKPLVDRAVSSERRSGNLYSGPDPVPSADVVASIGKDVVDVRDEVVPQGERLTLDVSMRAGTLLLVATAAGGFGHASHEVLDANFAGALRAISESLIVAHVFLACYASASLAPKLGRNGVVWGIKVLLSGPLGISSLKRCGAIDKSPQL